MINKLSGRLGALLLLACCGGIAQAQYVWIDAKGQKTFSDQPPPANIPLDKILRSPKKAPEKFELVDPNAPKPAEPVAAKPEKPAQPTLAERNAEFKKRQMERAEAEAKAAEELARRAQQADSCAAARQSLAQMESGERIRVQGADGEAAFMDDNARAAAINRIRQSLANCQ
jgi:type IV secretory pathway VirB10-like protein